MITAPLHHWIEHPETLNRKTLYELRTLLTRYPYCQTLRLLYLKNLFLLRDSSFGSELRKSVFYVTDRRVLFYLIEGDKFKLPTPLDRVISKEKEEEPSVDRTLSLIDAFLAELPSDEFQNTELDYSIDYTTYLLEGDTSSQEEPEDVPELRGQKLIDNFITKAAHEPVIKLDMSEENELSTLTDSLSNYVGEDEDDTYFTETLAKIYIKQQRYSKALEIIKKLSLKYPKKNIYFADQIRFLEKLIINAKS